MLHLESFANDACLDPLLLDPPRDRIDQQVFVGRKTPISLHIPLPSEREEHIALRFPKQVRLIPKVSQEAELSVQAYRIPKLKARSVRIASLQVKDEVKLPTFSWPVLQPELTSRFGPRWGKYHYGIDMISRNGDVEIKAAKTGRVVKSERTAGGYGNLVILDHGDGLYTYYAHLSKRFVKEGELVRAGEILGIMGDTGNTTGVHLHFEVRKKHEPLNPLDLLPK